MEASGTYRRITEPKSPKHRCQFVASRENIRNRPLLTVLEAIELAL
jgi:hypothetical protein